MHCGVENLAGPRCGVIKVENDSQEDSAMEWGFPWVYWTNNPVQGGRVGVGPYRGKVREGKVGSKGGISEELSPGLVS